jgi:ankyrin repeat protein
MERLLEMGRDANTPDCLGRAMLQAIGVGPLQLLLEVGAELEQRDDDGRTPLFSAGIPEMARLLLAAGARVDARDQTGATPLIHWAGVDTAADPEADARLSALCRVLLSCGADIDAREHNGDTALMRAAWNDHAGVVRVLLEAGADPTIICRDGGWKGLTALDVAVGTGVWTS